MADIQYIHNVTSQVAFGRLNPPDPEPVPDIPEWEVPLTGIPDVMPDECIIRSISFNGSLADGNAYMIWCSLKNGFIGSFCGGNITSSSPQSRIWLNAPVNNRLQFKLYMPNGINNPPLSAPAMVGDLIIHMDLIKYRRVPQHA